MIKDFKYQRIIFLDELRGFLVLCMIIFHALYSFVFIFNWFIFTPWLNFFKPTQPWFAGGFILISGICCAFSRSNFKRGIKLFLIAMLISLLTIFFIPEQSIYFGILHMLSISMVLGGLLKPIFEFFSYKLGIIICIVLFLLTKNIERGIIGFGNLNLFYLPQNFYKLEFLFPLGIKSQNFYSADYFPILPWIFLFFLGIFLGNWIIKKQLPQIFSKTHVKFLEFMGKHSLIIYLLHQPIILGLAKFLKIFLIKPL